jgi:AcrR family transcriptional regulator
MPRVADPVVGAALVEAAARILAEEGPAALTTRRVATEAGTSTMAVYTHFGGKEELVRAIVWEGFERLARRLAAVGTTDDPVADVCAQGLAYCANAHENPHLYAAMFGSSPVPEYRPTPDDATHGYGTFLTLVATVQRCIDVGRFRDGEAISVARQLWAAAHGVVTLEQRGYLEPDDAVLSGMTIALAVGLGDDPTAANASTAAARARATRF